MNEIKYPTGTRLLCEGIRGTIVTNCKMPGDICVVWDEDDRGIISYDEEWLDAHAIIIGRQND